ncbi:MAG TPA: nucleotide exchange factor GrpE [Pyrinomonadaceae bacterium]|nr:nucleotide exchange factor GrpE [Pyrinomonadaceae bacterium]
MDKDEKRKKDPPDNEKEAEPIRVTDRRRIHLDGNGKSASANSAGPSLKPSYVEELETRTRAAEKAVLDVQARFEELREQLRRELDETRQRLNRSAEERSERSKAELIASLLPVLDNLQQAAEAAEGTVSRSDILEGLRGIVTNFENVLRNVGVEPFQSVGETFNPELHDAVETGTVETPDREDKVLAEYTRGYKLGDRLLRPARVKVGRPSESLAKTVN